MGTEKKTKKEQLLCFLHVRTVHQQYKGTFLLFQTDVHNYKIIGILNRQVGILIV